MTILREMTSVNRLRRMIHVAHVVLASVLDAKYFEANGKSCSNENKEDTSADINFILSQA